MPIHAITYLSDGYPVNGFLGLPEGWGAPSDAVPHSQRLPGLIYCRGGIGKVGMVNLAWVEEFASYGYAVFAPAYRGNHGGPGRDEFGGADREDVHAAFRLLRNLPLVNPDDVSIMGFSRGAINAALTAAQFPEVRRLILWGGVSNLQATYEQRIDLRRMLKRVIGGSPDKLPEAYRSRSPISFAEQIACPILIMHGNADVQVDFSHGLAMYQRLKELGKQVTFHHFEDGGHHLAPPDHTTAVHNMFAWLAQRQEIKPSAD